MKKVLIALAVAAVFAIPFSVFAATSDTAAAKSIRGFFGIDTSKLTTQQKADVTSYTKKMAELQKEFIDKMVANGTITKAQGDTEKERIDEALKNGDVGSFLNGMGKGPGEPKEVKGPNIDISKLSDTQTAELKAIVKNIIDLEKSNVAKAVTNGLLTKDQGAAVTGRLDAEAANLNNGNGSLNLREYMGNFGGLMLFGKGMRNTALTAQQKTDLTAFVKSLASLEKELIDKLIADGILTSVQGESLKARIDEMTRVQIDNGFTKSIMGQKGMNGFKGHGRMDGSFENGGNSGTGSSGPASGGVPGLSGSATPL